MDVHIQSQGACLDPSQRSAHSMLMYSAGFLTGAQTVVCMAGSAKYFLGGSTVCVSTFLSHPLVQSPWQWWTT